MLFLRSYVRFFVSLLAAFAGGLVGNLVGGFRAWFLLGEGSDLVGDLVIGVINGGVIGTAFGLAIGLLFGTAVQAHLAARANDSGDLAIEIGDIRDDVAALSGRVATLENLPTASLEMAQAEKTTLSGRPVPRATARS